MSAPPITPTGARLRLAILSAFVLCASGAALAHGGHDHGGAAVRMFNADPLVLIPLLAAGAAYAVGSARLRLRAGPGAARTRRAWFFWSGWLVLGASLLSPLHGYGERLFVAHMAEHMLIMSVAALLLALGFPGPIMLWALPQRARRKLGAFVSHRFVARIWKGANTPSVATGLHAVAIWIWHAPSFYEAALAANVVHWAQHLSFLVTGYMFWRAIAGGLVASGGHGAAALHLFFTGMHTGLIGALLTFAGRVVYPQQSSLAHVFGLSPLEDQHLAGLLMWLPGGLFYMGAALVCIGAWLTRMGARTRTQGGLA